MRGGGVRKLILIISLCLALAGCEKKTEKPFGFEWGQSSSAIKAMQLNGYLEASKDDGITQILLRDSPVKQDFLHDYFAYIDRNLGLIAVEGRSRVMNLSLESDAKSVAAIYNYLLSNIESEFEEKNSTPREKVHESSLMPENERKIENNFAVEFRNGLVVATLKIQRQKGNDSIAWVSLTYALNPPKT